MLSFPHIAVINTYDKIPKQIKVTFLSCFIIGILTHIFMLTNKLPNHDDILWFADNSSSWTKWCFSLGRWFVFVPFTFSGIFSLPWVNGLLYILYISVAACFVVSLLKIHNHLYCMIIAGLMVTFPAVTSSMTFMWMADVFGFSLVFACLAAFIAEKYKYGFIFAVIPLILSLAVYQAYFGATAGLLILILIIEVLKNEVTWQKTLFKGIRFTGTLSISLIIYIALTKLFMHISETEPTDYQGIDKMGKIVLSEIPTQIFNAYGNIIQFLLPYSPFETFLAVAFVFCFLFCIVLVSIRCIQQKIHQNPLKLSLLIVLLLLFPFGCNAVHFFGSDLVHSVMQYGMVFLLVFLIVIIDLITSNYESKEKYVALLALLSSWIVSLFMIILVFNYWIFANKAYLKMHMGYEQTYALSNTLVTRIQSTEGYTSHSEIVFVSWPSVNGGTPALDGSVSLFGVDGVSFSFGMFSFRYGRYEKYLMKYLNFTNKITYIRELKDLIEFRESKEFIEMPHYPDSGSIVMASDGKIYVNFLFRGKYF